jgi:hypothetical protein
MSESTIPKVKITIDGHPLWDVPKPAADEIERLTAEYKKLLAQHLGVLDRIAELEADLFSAELKANTFEQGYDVSQEARRYLEKELAKLRGKG